MSELADYFATERLRDGRAVEIRALRPDDKDDMLAAISRTGTESMQRRFFAVKRGFSEKEIAFFMNIDFTNHVALAALAKEDGRKVIIAGGRYIIVEPGQAEIAFIVIDAYQGQGVGTMLMRHLAAYAAREGIGELFGYVLRENNSMLQLCRSLGFLQEAVSNDPTLVRVVLPLAPPADA